MQSKYVALIVISSLYCCTIFSHSTISFFNIIKPKFNKTQVVVVVFIVVAVAVAVVIVGISKETTIYNMFSCYCRCCWSNFFFRVVIWLHLNLSNCIWSRNQNVGFSYYKPNLYPIRFARTIAYCHPRMCGQWTLRNMKMNMSIEIETSKPWHCKTLCGLEKCERNEILEKFFMHKRRLYRQTNRPTDWKERG